MFCIKALATQLIDRSSYPEIVLCEIVDTNGCKHQFIEKWSMVSTEKFENIFPKECEIDCVILEERATSYVVYTEQPWYIESTEGKTIFEINKNLLIEKASVLKD